MIQVTILSKVLRTEEIETTALNGVPLHLLADPQGRPDQPGDRIEKRIDPSLRSG